MEMLLLGIAALIAWPLHRQVFEGFFWRSTDLLWGSIAALPMLLGFWWLLKSQARFAANIRRFFELALRPTFGQWSLAQLAIISFLAGVCEEVLFRGVLQAGLSKVTAPWTGLAAASVAFGLAHPISKQYIVAAAIVGFFLGWLYLVTGNLLAPVTAHAVYDFCALTWFLRLHRGDPR